MTKRKLEKRNIVLIYVFSILTLGIYAVVWNIKTKRDINAIGGDIPTSWLIIVPFANVYWVYKYAKSFSEDVKKDDSATLWFCVSLFAGFVMPYFVQKELNNHIDKNASLRKKKEIAARKSQAKVAA